MLIVPRPLPFINFGPAISEAAEPRGAPRPALSNRRIPLAGLRRGLASSCAGFNRPKGENRIALKGRPSTERYSQSKYVETESVDWRAGYHNIISLLAGRSPFGRPFRANSLCVSFPGLKPVGYSVFTLRAIKTGTRRRSWRP